MRHPERADGVAAVTIADVAARAGVSTATVSRALARPGSVTPGREQRVRRAVAELGFVPNPAARALASHRTGLVGLIVPVVASATQAQLLSAVTAGLSGWGVATITAVESETTLAWLAAQGAAAVVRLGVPHLGASPGDRPAATVPCLDLAIDDEATARGVAWTLVALGHRRIRLDCEPQGDGDAEAIARGLRVVIESAGGEVCRPSLREPVGVGCRGSDAGANADVSAIVCNSDLRAAEVMLDARVARRNAVSVIGWGDSAVAQRLGLASVRWPHAALVAEAVAFLTGADASARVAPVGKVVLRHSLIGCPTL